MLICAILLLAAVLADALLGDPAYALHPVRLIGRTIQKFEAPFRSLPVSEFLAGTLLTLTVLGTWGGAWTLAYRLLQGTELFQFLCALLFLYSCLALRDLARHIHPVLDALDQRDHSLARKELQKIVGRDTSVLDEAGILRASLETAAEGFVDGFLSPVFWFALLSLLGGALDISPCLTGIAGALGYRVINTLDSMIGYKSNRYLFFGRFAARLDDVVNFIPARLSVLFLFLSAWILKADAGSGLETVVRHRHHAASPNAGYPESFVAGALHVRIGGPIQYPFGRVDKPFIGDGTRAPSPETVRRATRLVTLAGYLAAGITALFICVAPVLTR